MINGVLRIGIYGGTFSPPHNGHKAALRAFMEQMKLDYAYVIPTGIPPHKSVGEQDDPARRLRMCELAFGDMEGVVVSDMEIRRGGKSYTVDTLRELSGENRRLFLLCGTDMILSLDRWYGAEEIFRLCYPIYVRRENDKMIDGMLVSKVKDYAERYGAIVRRVVCESVELSSTEIRADVSAGRSIADKVPPAVAAYIAEHGLYR